MWCSGKNSGLGVDMNSNINSDLLQLRDFEQVGQPFLVPISSPGFNEMNYVDSMKMQILYK